MKPIHQLSDDEQPARLIGLRCKHDRSRLARVYRVDGRDQYMALELDDDEHRARLALIENVPHMPEATFFQYIWLDEGDDKLPAYCPRCGQRWLERPEVVALVAQAKSTGKYREYSV